MNNETLVAKPLKYQKVQFMHDSHFISKEGQLSLAIESDLSFKPTPFATIKKDKDENHKNH